MPPLALVVCPLPADRPAMRAAHSLLNALTEPAVIFCPEPNQAPAAWLRRHRLLPLADLAHERSLGHIAAPAFLHDGGPGEGTLQRAAARVPGVRIDAHAALPSPAALRQAVAAIATPPSPRVGGPTVEAMVLSYKSKHYISPCLESLLAQDWPNLKITVFDNASGDGTAEFVRRQFPTIEVLESTTNLGFAEGHNRLFARTQADFVALLNHDAVARRDWCAELVAAATARPDGVAFGAKMLMRRCPTILNSTGIAMNESGFAADRDIGRPDLDPADAPERVFAVCGGAMLLRGDALRRLGGFDPTFFMYVEDVDWCWRARIAGHEVYYVPTATVVHDWHGDMAAANRPEQPVNAAAAAELEGRRRSMIERNRLQAVIKNYEWRNLRRVWRGLVQHDRGRIEALRAHVARGGGPLPQRVLEAVQAGRRWCRRHALGLWLRRLRTQAHRRVADATFAALITPGCHEPVGVGDLHAIVDRHCATGRDRIVMACGDAGSLGPGWHHPEPAADGTGGWRWSMAECWFYLQRDADWTAVQMTLVPHPRDTWAELWIDGVVVGRQPVAKDQPHVLRWDLPTAMLPRQLAECRLRCGVFVPKAEGLGDDARELGLHVATIDCR